MTSFFSRSSIVVQISSIGLRKLKSPLTPITLMKNLRRVVNKKWHPFEGPETRLSVASERFDRYINNNNVITCVCIHFVLLGTLTFMQIKET